MQAEKNGGRLAVARVAAAGVLGICATLLILFLLAALLYSEILPASWLGLCPYAALFVGGVGCGVCSARCPKRLYGALGGALLMAACFLLLGFFFVETDFAPAAAAIACIVCLVSAVLGSVVTSLFR